MRPVAASETADAGDAKDKYTIGALSNGLDVLSCFEERDAWSLTELTARLPMSKATAFRVLATLEAQGFVAKRPEDGRYVAGPRVVTLARGAVRYEQLRWQSLPPLLQLAKACGESVHVGVLFEGNVVTVQVVDGHFDVRMHTALGKRSPAHASSIGKAILANYADPEIAAYLAQPGLTSHTPHTITDPGAFREALREVRNDGFAVDNEEVQLGVRCVGAAIHDLTGRVVAGVSASGPTSRMTDARATELAPVVRATARTISRMLGSPTLDFT